MLILQKSNRRIGIKKFIFNFCYDVYYLIFVNVIIVIIYIILFRLRDLCNGRSHLLINSYCVVLYIYIVSCLILTVNK